LRHRISFDKLLGYCLIIIHERVLWFGTYIFEIQLYLQAAGLAQALMGT